MNYATGVRVSLEKGVIKLNPMYQDSSLVLSAAETFVLPLEAAEKLMADLKSILES